MSMTKKEILSNLKEVVKILGMDYHEYLSYSYSLHPDRVLPTDYYSLFTCQCEECISIISWIFSNCHRELDSIGGYVFLKGDFVRSSFPISDIEADSLRLSSGRYMNTYGNVKYGADWYLPDDFKCADASVNRACVDDVLPVNQICF